MPSRDSLGVHLRHGDDDLGHLHQERLLLHQLQAVEQEDHHLHVLHVHICNRQQRNTVQQAVKKCSAKGSTMVEYYLSSGNVRRNLPLKWH